MLPNWLAADQRYALEQLKVGSTLAFFVDRDASRARYRFEELEERLTPWLER